MKDLDALLKIGTDGAALDVRRKRQAHPPGWEPLVITETGGYVTTPPQATPPENWDAFLAELLPEGMDPKDYEIDGSTVEVRAWDGNIGNGELKRFYYFKARIKRRVTKQLVDLEELLQVTKRYKPAKRVEVADDRTYGIHITDLQAGQADGDGVEGLVNRVRAIPALVKADLLEMKKAGKPAGSIFVPITGDLVEGINGWYATQTFSVQLDRRDQVKLVRRLLAELLLDLASTGLPVHVATVPGNHGENRQDGKAFTTFSDNDDLALVEQVAESFSLGGIDNVTFSFPQRDRLSMTVLVQGHVVGLTHGHVARSSGSVEAKILDWYKRMAASKDPLGDSEILFTGHYHHARYQQLVGGLEWIQGGALCDSSAWFSQTAGLVNDPVVMRFTITKEQCLEWIAPYRWRRTQTQAVTV